MPDSYSVHELRLAQEYLLASAADQDAVGLTAVPSGIIRTILQASLNPSVAETKIVWFTVQTKAGYTYPITVPTSVALTTVVTYPLLTQGLELKLLPGDILRANRDSHTAGSTITLIVRYLDSTMPLYEELDLHAQQRRRKGIIGSIDVLSGGSRGSASGPRGGMGFGRGGGGGPRQV